MRNLKRGTEVLWVDLTPAEFNAKAKELAEKQEELSLERESQKEQKTEMKRRVELIEQARAELSRVVRKGAEEREVQIEQHADDKRGVLQYVRMDTGEVFKERPLQDGERQLSAFDAPDGSVTVTTTASGTRSITKH